MVTLSSTIHIQSLLFIYNISGKIYIGVLANGTLWQWSHADDGRYLIPLPEPIMDIVRNNETLHGCSCTIGLYSGTVSCNICDAATASLSRLAVIDPEAAGALNRSAHLTLYGGKRTDSNGICLLIDGMVVCSGPDTDRFRWGAYAMLPRTSLRRIVHIAVDGIDYTSNDA